ncbi:hypothetical protein CPB84DRAFT_1766476 [Gymnopilus junonius]|uniref:Uncharacterized protein n=1 Tax=Gymnopilus junonius TaxID=109634 RepID=A0A9P5TRL4_GYMJU|nr:hypothetical protein CPB84DRAFT_1766476 [Gymnopilus junonius]
MSCQLKLAELKKKLYLGYSKLNKEAIIGKLLNWQSGASALKQGRSSSELTATPSTLYQSNDLAIIESQSGFSPLAPATLRASRPDVRGVNVGVNHSALVPKRPRCDLVEPSEPSQKKKASSNVTPTALSERIQPKALLASLLSVSQPSSHGVGQNGPLPMQSVNPHIESNISLHRVFEPIKRPPRRFNLLVVKRDLPDNVSVPDIRQNSEGNVASLEYLDFPLEEHIWPHTVSLPPLLAERKHIPNLSVILSGISFTDLRTCALVSRTFRYAAYVSAAHQLSRRFPGERMFNLWPYLISREQEVESRRAIYEASFLFQTCKGLFEINEALWSSPDHSKQANIAVRFIVTRLFFMFSTKQAEDENVKEATSAKILDVQEVVKDEIWKITYHSRSSIQELFVLESTCEVIGKADVPLETSAVPYPLNFRTDWAAYIQSKLSPDSQKSNVQSQGLLDYLHWPNHEEYTRGISNLWLKRVKGEGTVGLAKLVVAQRYVLACVASNSVSGPWRTANEMAQEFDGRPSFAYSSIPRDSKTKKINLFLPA